jgi:ABC-2 type transport system ATP-binding protein
VDLDLASGEILGLLGPNGAGKTTLLRRLAGLLPGHAGTVDIGGGDPASDPGARARLGYLPEDPPLYPEDTALQYVRYMGALSGVARGRRAEAADKALARSGADHLAGRLCGRLSRGQRQRVALAAAIVHDPDVLLLDEPSEGLDPQQKVAFRSLLSDLRRRTAIVFSTHVLAEAQAVCDRTVVIDHGKIVLDRPTAAGATRLQVVVVGAEPAAVRALLSGVAGVRSVEGTVCNVETPEVAEAIAAAVCERGWRLRQLGPAPDELEAAFLAAVTGGPDRPRQA